MYDTQFVAMLATAMVTMSVMILALYVITVIAYWQIFKKAGEKGWKSLIPLYNSYIMYKISWKTSMFWIMLILDIVYAVLACINVYAQNGILSFLSFAIYIAVFVIAIISMHKLSKGIRTRCRLYSRSCIAKPYIHTDSCFRKLSVCR